MSESISSLKRRREKRLRIVNYPDEGNVERIEWNGVDLIGIDPVHVQKRQALLNDVYPKGYMISLREVYQRLNDMY